MSNGQDQGLLAIVELLGRAARSWATLFTCKRPQLAIPLQTSGRVYVPVFGVHIPV